MNDYVRKLLDRNPNPSPPLPKELHVQDKLRFWPEDTDYMIFLQEQTDLRTIFLRLQKKWPDVKMEEVVMGIAEFQTADSRYGLDQEIFITLEKVEPV